jgi:hypothetical protein
MDSAQGAASSEPAEDRHVVERDGYRIAVDELQDGSLLAEIDDGNASPTAVPTWLDVIADVTEDERWTGSERVAD